MLAPRPRTCDGASLQAVPVNAILFALATFVAIGAGSYVRLRRPMDLCPAHGFVGFGGPLSPLLVVRRLGGRPEFALFGAAYLVYTAARWIFVGDFEDARGHAHRIVESSAPWTWRSKDRSSARWRPGPRAGC